MPLRVIIADSFDYGCNSMENFLRENFDCELIHKTNKGSDVVYLLQHNRFDLVIADMDLYDMPTAELCRQLAQLQLPVPVIGLSTGDEYYQCRSMLDAGCRGFLMRNVGNMELRHCINIVSSGTTYVCPRCHHLLVSRLQKQNELDNFGQEVLAKVVEKKDTIEIAMELFSSKGKVKRARQRIIRMAGDRSPYGIMRWAVYYGYISLKITAAIAA